MASAPTAATAFEPLFTALLGHEIPIRIEFWDGSGLGRQPSPATVTIHRPEALRRVLYAPSELGFGRAFVLGEIDIAGDAVAAFSALDAAAPDDLRIGAKTLLRVLRRARSLGVLGRPLPPPAEEARLTGRLHTKGRDAAAIAHHYDVSNAFYELVLGPTMTYSCARFVTADTGLDAAQIAKYELISRKLGLQPGMRLLDVGCGWGGMVGHAASEHGVDAVGITLSRPQYEWARKTVADRGLVGRVDVRIQDYRDLADDRFDAISSIGMFEHVGRVRLAEYFHRLASLLPPGGRLLNHGISTPEGAAFDRHSFVARYVFPDGELHDVATVVAGMEAAGLEVRDVESLREHYALTLRHWVANLEHHWDDAVGIVGEVRARIWRLYMLGSIAGFESGDISVHQVLGVKPDEKGASHMPLTREAFG